MSPLPDFTGTLAFVASPSPCGVGGIDLDSDEALVILTPTLGPSATLLAHRLARYCANAPCTFGVDELGMSFGLGRQLLMRALARLELFGVITRVGDAPAWVVRLHIIPDKRWLAQLPAYLQCDLERFGHAPSPNPVQPAPSVG